MQSDQQYEKIDLSALLRVLWRRRWVVLASAFLATTIGLAYALLAQEWFRVEVVLVQTDNKDVSSAASQLGGLASLAGIDIRSTGLSPVPVAVLGSREFARDFILDNNLTTVVLFDKWDEPAGKWKAAGTGGEPDIRDAVERFDQEIRSIGQSRKDGLITLSITWIDAEVASEWANLLVARINSRMRQQAINEAETNIRNLKQEMAGTAIVPLQQSMAKVLESEMQKLMLANGAEQYAFKVIDPARPPKVRSFPHRGVIVLAAFLLGCFCSSLLVVAVSSRNP